MRRPFWAMLAVLGLAAADAAASGTYIGCRGHTRLQLPRLSAAPVIDGALDDPVWQQAAVLDSFTHNRPTEGVRDTLGTTCFVYYDDSHLYVAFRCKDDPAAIQAPIVPRDQIYQGDWVGVSLDTYHDQQQSFFLGVSPQGIQMDGVDQEGNDTDMSRDFLYTTRARVTDDGYEVEMAIPFKSLRIPEHDPLTFGFNAIRDVRRDGTHMYWAPISRDQNNYHSQLGALESIVGVRPGRNLQITPTLTGMRRGTRNDLSEFEHRNTSRTGMDVKFGLTSSLIVDATVTPDFSQIESDAGVVDINERFAIFFPERRPFFLEGSDIFDSPTNLVHTRQIADPRAGLKLTGKQGRTSIGVLSAIDKSAGESLETLPDHANPYADRDAIFNVARFKRDVLKSSFVGLMLANREQDETYNRLAGIDGRLNFNGRYTFTFQGVGSWARDRDLRSAIAGLTPAEDAELDDDLRDLDGRMSNGETWYFSANRESRNLGLFAFTRGVSPDFRADMGFIQRTDAQEYGAWVNEHYFGKQGAWWTAVHTWTGYERTHDYGSSGKRTDDIFVKGGEIILPRNSWIGAGYNNVYTHFDGRAFPGQHRLNLWGGSDRFQAIRPGYNFNLGDIVIFDEVLPGTRFNWEFWSDLRFTRQMDAGLSVRGSTVRRKDGATKFRDALIPRLRLSYQFTRELSVRLIGETRRTRDYDTSGAQTDRNSSATFDVLATYLLRPGTVVFLGYGSLLEGNRLEDAKPQANSLFMKLSYLWQN